MSRILNFPLVFQIWCRGSNWETKLPFKSYFNENLVAVQLNKIQVFMNTPIYVGFSVLDLYTSWWIALHHASPSRSWKYKLLYNRHWQLGARHQRHQHLCCHKEQHTVLQHSDYPENNCFQLPRVNKKIVGLMKDERNWVCGPSC